jgi:indolepyruvate ferredoxin oxidoreductase beta subunit
MISKPFTILICALGGEGGGVLTDWLVNTARLAHVPIQATSIPGVAQRTGATTYYLELMREPEMSTNQAARRPVFGLSPLPGQIDLLISSELLETARQISNGMSSAQKTCIISSSNRTLTTQERMGLGDSRLPDHELVRLIQEHSLKHHLLDMAQLAKDSGTIISSVMLGCIAGSGLLPFKKEHYEQAIKGLASSPSNAQLASLKGFQMGLDCINQQSANAQFVHQLMNSIEHQSRQHSDSKRIEHIFEFPESLHEILTLGYNRLVEYQNKAYADLYIEKIKSVFKEEQKYEHTDALMIEGEEQKKWPITHEAARWTALWMAFDDIVRVAQLKIRQDRFSNIRAETKAKTGDLIKVYDHFKPGIAELAGLLPGAIAKRLLEWEERRVRAGHEPLELKIKLQSTGLRGALTLKMLSSLKWLRAIGRRYQLEHADIDQWLSAVRRSTQMDQALGYEVAACARLIKGYGSTNQRAHENLEHILKTLLPSSELNSSNAQSQIIRQARLNALKEESGQPLDAFLKGLGVAPRPPKEQPIRWMKRPSKVSQNA